MHTRHFILIFFLFGYGIFFSQIDTLNQLDENNCKFGYWKNYKDFEGQSEKSLLDEGLFVNGRKTGPWTEYYQDGNVRNRLCFLDGRPNGFQILYYQNCDTLEYGNFTNGKWLGKHVSFYPNKQVHNIYHYTQTGKKDGCQISYFENGTIAKESEFIDGVELYSKEFYVNGNPKVISIAGKYYKTFYQNQSIQSSISYQKNNSYTEISYFSNGNKSSVVHYKNTKRDGAVTQYYENGNLKLQCAYKEGKMYGKRVYYDNTGKKIDNAMVMYDNKHLIEREGFCKNGKPEGELKVYDSEGNITMLANFVKGKPNGNTYYYYNNKLKSTEVYTNGVFVREVGK